MPASRSLVVSTIPKVNEKTGGRSSSTTASERSSRNGGANRLTANGASVAARTSRIAVRSSSGVIVAPAIEPSAPAFETAAARAGG
jgi:hypothetical protein